MNIPNLTFRELQKTLKHMRNQGCVLSIPLRGKGINRKALQKEYERVLSVIYKKDKKKDNTKYTLEYVMPLFDDLENNDAFKKLNNKEVLKSLDIANFLLEKKIDIPVASLKSLNFVIPSGGELVKLIERIDCNENALCLAEAFVYAVSTTNSIPLTKYKDLPLEPLINIEGVFSENGEMIKLRAKKGKCNESEFKVYLSFCKEIKGRKWNGDEKSWEFPLSEEAVEKILNFSSSISLAPIVEKKIQEIHIDDKN